MATWTYWSRESPPGGVAFYRNDGKGVFTRLTDTTAMPFLALPDMASAAWGDYDNDGSLDLFVANASEGGLGKVLLENFLYHNDGSTHGWLKVRLAGVTSNRMGVGAKVRVRTTVPGRGEMWQRREITAGGVYNGSQFHAHFGLGTATRADRVRIEWPSGIVQELTDVAGRQTLLVTEPELIRLGIQRQGEGFAIECQGAPSAAYELQSSGDLRTWSPLATLTTDAAGRATSGVTPQSSQARFYRAVRK